jgi:hypothetical protein
MSFHLISIDTLMQLDIPTLTYALDLFQKELDGTIAYMHENLEARTDQKVQDDLRHLLTLRKVFQGRVEELKAEQAKAEVKREELAKEGVALVAALA